MKTIVTLRLDSDLVRHAKLLAARRGSSFSGLLTQLLEELVRKDHDYASARSRALDRLAKGYDLGGSRPPSRDELHQR